MFLYILQTAFNTTFLNMFREKKKPLDNLMKTLDPYLSKKGHIP